MTLSEYNKKRNFAVTSEPKGKKNKSKGKRFVVQFHRARRDHYDFRLEEDGVLISFAIPKGFSYDSHDKRLAVHVEDHPLEYFNFEGRIPKDEYGAGIAIIYDKGHYEADGKISDGIEKGEFKVTLFGEKLKGKWAFIHFKEDNFLVICENGEIKKEQKKKSQKPKETRPTDYGSIPHQTAAGCGNPYSHPHRIFKETAGRPQNASAFSCPFPRLSILLQLLLSACFPLHTPLFCVHRQSICLFPDK